MIDISTTKIIVKKQWLIINLCSFTFKWLLNSDADLQLIWQTWLNFFLPE